jgi:hypothetical protein
VEREKLAKELAQRMREIVPASIGLRNEGSMLWYSNIEPDGARLGGSRSYACDTPEVEHTEHWIIAACWHAFDDRDPHGNPVRYEMDGNA